MFEELLRKVDQVQQQQVGACYLVEEWKQPSGSRFRLPGAERLQNDHLLQDLSYVSDTVAKMGFQGLVLCIDEADRIDPYALSALKSALLSINSYLVVLSVRLAEDHGDPIRAGRLRLEAIATKADRDLGAARIFVGGIGLGSFTPAQARQCIELRLRGNTIHFGDNVIDLIARVAGGLPDRIIAYAHKVYDRVEAANANTADVESFRQVFIEEHQVELDEARALRAQSTSFECRMLRELAKGDSPATPLDLARKLHPGLPADVLESVVDGLRSVLDRLSGSLCTRNEGRYFISDPVRRYALEISMEPE